MFGATVGAAMNYALYSPGIKALEISEKVVRGAKGSYVIPNGAFGMMPHTGLLGTRGALIAEIGMTAALAFAVFALTDEDKSVPAGAQPALVGTTVAALAN